MHLRRVLVHTNEVAAGKSTGHHLPDAIGALRIGDGDSELMGFRRQLFLEDQLIDDLLGVKRPERSGNGAVLFDAAHLPLNILRGNGVVAHLRDDIGATAHGIGVALRHEIEKHPDTQNPDNDSKQNSNAQLFSIHRFSPELCELRGAAHRMRPSLIMCDFRGTSLI